MLEAVLASRVFPSRYELMRHCAKLAEPGVACEFGVFKGHSLRTIRHFRKPPVFGFDSFEGLPEQWDTGSDAEHPAGHFACDLPDVGDAVLVPGWFDTTIPAWKAANPEPVRLLHVDSDLYSSAVTVLRGLDDRIVPGTVIVFDELVDFAGGWYPNWREGEWRALCEWVDGGRAVEPVGRTEWQQAAFIVRN
jgi:hypothetical protein